MNGEVRLSDGDFERLRRMMVDTVRKETPPIVRNELVNIGLAVHDGEGRVSAQKDMAFLHRMRGTFESASVMIGRAVLLALLAVFGAVMAAGFWSYFKGGN